MQNRPVFKSVADSYAAYLAENRVYLQTVVQCTRSGVGDWIKNYASGIAHRRELHPSLVPAAAWRTVYGTYNEITHLYAFDSLAEMDRLRKVLFSDPENLECMKENTSPVLPNNWETSSYSKILKPLPYSTMK